MCTYTAQQWKGCDEKSGKAAGAQRAPPPNPERGSISAVPVGRRTVDQETTEVTR